jgi:hypothetical protein
MLGNNARSTKFKRIYVPLIIENQIGGTFGGRYYLPENPELEKKTITGIQVHLGDSLGDGDISVPNATILLATQAENVPAANPVVPISYLTIYDADGSEKLLNFPINGLFNQDPARRFQRIPFIHGKINIPKSYIFIVQTTQVPKVLGYSITFFYN